MSLRSLVALLIFLVFVAPFSASTASALSEDQVMAAFLLNFARYVEWPAKVFTSDQAPVRICMLGSAEFGEVVSNTVSGKNVGDRAVTVEMKTNLSGASDCHVLFIGSEFAAPNAEAIAALGNTSIFTVADREGFALDGGIANFFRDDNKIRFEINPKAAKRADLKISSRLLRLAKVVN